MQHLDEGTIHSWLDGALSADEAARVEAHVAECPQCAAAVAEARGFIAASSRILTALDHVPRGVVPAVRRARWSNPAVWRAAAAVLVVAAGSLVVVRNAGKNSATTFSTIQKADTGSVQRMASPTVITDSSTQTVATARPQSNIGPTEKRTGQRPATDASAATEQAVAATTSRVADLGNARIRSSQPNLLAGENSAAAAQASSGIGEKASPARGYANVQPALPRIVIRGNMTAVAAGDSLSELVPLKVVGTRRQIGARVTLYEVAPNDTVTLTEIMNARLEAVVTTGISTVTQEGRPTAKSSAAAPPQRADAAVANPQDSQREARVAAAPARPPSAPAPVTAVETANGVTTITWTDATTGNVLKLSGRMPGVQLLQLKIRVERERAAAAAAAKRNP